LREEIFGIKCHLGILGVSNLSNFNLRNRKAIILTGGMETFVQTGEFGVSKS